MKYKIKGKKTQNAWGIFPTPRVSSGMDATWEVGPLPFGIDLGRRLKGYFAVMVKKGEGCVMKHSLLVFLEEDQVRNLG